jgi:hypothetical protein
MKKAQVIQIRADDAWVALVDEWRRVQPDLPVRSEAIRRMVIAAAKLPASPRKP